MKKQNGATTAKLTRPLKSKWSETQGTDFILL